MARFIRHAGLIVLCIGIAVVGGDSFGQDKLFKEQIVGAWTLVSVSDVQKDGTRVPRLGPAPKGSLMFDGSGRYSLVIVRSDIPKFASGRGDEGTADENKAVMQGLVAHFGSYSVSQGDRILTIRAEGSWLPNLNGVERKLTITSLTADELRYTNPAPAVVVAPGASSEIVWRRAR